MVGDYFEPGSRSLLNLARSCRELYGPLVKRLYKAIHVLDRLPKAKHVVPRFPLDESSSSTWIFYLDPIVCMHPATLRVNLIENARTNFPADGACWACDDILKVCETSSIFPMFSPEDILLPQNRLDVRMDMLTVENELEPARSASEPQAAAPRHFPLATDLLNAWNTRRTFRRTFRT